MINDLREVLQDTEGLFRMLGQDGYIHLLMEPIFTYGIGFGLLLFIVTLIARERTGRTLALLVLMVCSIFIYPYQHKRQEAAARPGSSESWTAETQKLWDDQTERRRPFHYLYYLLAVAALLNIVISPASLLGKGLAAVVLIVGGVVLICGLWLDLHEKRIFHPGLRDGSGGNAPVTRVLAPSDQLPDETV